ncbi:MAG: hypothetical protein JW825_00185 [Candidatus Methanofastidiosa archaeon]|nr:hypothetical protein [Candidatus Methanofastidiosa archaeon]
MKKVGFALLFVIALSLLPLSSAAPIEIKYFYSSGCSHCKTTSAILDQVEDHYGDVVNIERININVPTNQAIWDEYKSRYNIGGVPAIIINEDKKLEGDIKINYSAVLKAIDELLEGIEVKGDEYYVDGIAAMGNGKFDTAIDFFNDAIEIYTAAENQTKINLCNLKIQNCNDYILARNKFIEAENLYLAGDYESAKLLYEEIIQIYYDIGNESMASTSEVRLQNCNFYISYADASLAFENKEWAAAIESYNDAKSYTSKKETIDAINELISFCETQISAEGLYVMAEEAFSSESYIDAKQYYIDASLLFSDADKIMDCTAKAALCDSYMLANDTYEYAMGLYGEEDYEAAMATFANARELYLALGEDGLAQACDDSIDEIQSKLDEIAYQKQLEDEEREHQKNMKMIYISVAAISIIAFFSVLILYYRRRGAPASYEAEYAAEDEEEEGETQ